MNWANSPKQITVATTQELMVIQKPNFGSKCGNSKNIGRVEITYQKV
jgi:hypothetical protein